MKRENKNKKQRRRVEKKMIDPPPNISIIILNINVINTQFKRQTFSEQVKKKKTTICCLEMMLFTYQSQEN